MEEQKTWTSSLIRKVSLQIVVADYQLPRMNERTVLKTEEFAERYAQL